MKVVVLIFLVWLSPFCSAGQRKDNPLTNTRWNYVGVIYNSTGELHTCSNSGVYSIHFKEGREVEGRATVRYKGKYRIKKNNVLVIRVFISKATDLGSPNADEFQCRLDYSGYIGDRELRYAIEDGKLTIYSGKYVTMVYEPADG